jgi:hypothetical protein
MAARGSVVGGVVDGALAVDALLLGDASLVGVDVPAGDGDGGVADEAGGRPSSVQAPSTPQPATSAVAWARNSRRV